MSFGWSTDDLITETTFTRDVLRALSESEGLTGDWHEAVGFLKCVDRIL
jgi:hypothetical protein